MILIVTYDLKTPKDYHEFYEAVKQQGKWWHYMAWTWLLSTEKTPTQIVDALQSFLDPQDLLFVCELAPNYQGRLPKPAWEFINNELKAPMDYTSLINHWLANPAGATGTLSDMVAPPGNPLAVPDWFIGPPTEKKK